MRVQPIPDWWINVVTGILDEGDRTTVEWTFSAEQDWRRFGQECDAYELLAKTLRTPGILGHNVVGMRDYRDQSYSDCWAFLCRHPWDPDDTLYAKIGLHHSRVYINLFSLHVDDGTERLAKAIVEYNNADKSGNKAKKR
jgi:hypothetical protein